MDSFSPCLHSFTTFAEMWGQIDTGCHTRKEVVQLREKVKEGENLVAAATESVEIEDRKLKEELRTTSRLLCET